MCLAARSASASPGGRLMIDVDRDAAALLDTRATERLIELETADVDVPPPPAASARPPLYFRIVAASPASLRVELWELGAPYGARSVSVAGNANLKARRIALAAAELARRLRQRRLAELAAKREPAADDTDAGRAGAPIYGRLTWSAGLRGAAIGPSSAWVLGPDIGATLRFSAGPRLALRAAWLEGEASVFGSSARARIIDVGLACAEGFQVAPRLELTAGLAASAGAVRIGEPGGPASAPFDTWTSHAEVVFRAEGRLARSVWLGAGPDVGVVLTPVSTTGADGETHRIAGLWLGGALTLTVDPEAPRE